MAVTSYNTGVAWARAYLFDNGETRELPPLPGDVAAAANSVNSRAEVVGSSFDSGSRSRAVVWRNGIPHPLYVPAAYVSSSAVDINDDGVIAGTLDLPVDGAFVQGKVAIWENELQSILGDSGRSVRVMGINALGEVIWTSEPGAGPYRDFKSRRGSIEKIIIPDSMHLWITDFNDRGEILGAFFSDQGRTIDFVHSNAGLRILQAKPEFDPNLYSFLFLNNHGDIIGEAGHFGEPILYSSSGRVDRLADLLPRDSGWRIQKTGNINDRGQIAALAGVSELRAILLNPRN